MYQEERPDPYKKVFIDSPIIIPESEHALRQMVSDLRMIEKLADTFLRLAAANDQQTILRLAQARS